MKTVGSLIKEARFKKNYSREKLSEITHIRVSFIAAIERGDWGNLPDFAVTLGFVKTISHFLNIPENQAVSFLRREYPPKLVQSERLKVRIPKQNFERKLNWGPRATFAVGVAVIILTVAGYLGFQYRKFNSPPTLIVKDPVQNGVIKDNFLTVDGKTDPDATLVINEQPVVLSDDGSFSVQLNISKATTTITFVAKSRSGKITMVSRNIRPEF